MCGVSSPPGARTAEKKITIVCPSIEGAKKMGWPVPTARCLALNRHRVRNAASRQRHKLPPRISTAVTGRKGRPNIQRIDDLRPAASVKQFSEWSTIGKYTSICTLLHPPLGVTKLPVLDRTIVGSAPHQPYGVAANIIGRMDPGWQTNSGSLVFDARWTDVWRELAARGPDREKKNHDSVPFNRRSQKKTAGLCQRPSL